MRRLFVHKNTNGANTHSSFIFVRNRQRIAMTTTLSVRHNNGRSFRQDLMGSDPRKWDFSWEPNQSGEGMLWYRSWEFRWTKITILCALLFCSVNTEFCESFAQIFSDDGQQRLWGRHQHYRTDLRISSCRM